nr:MAG TPA: hypothetical protein [Caudoviricetes sp.]
MLKCSVKIRGIFHVKLPSCKFIFDVHNTRPHTLP